MLLVLHLVLLHRQHLWIRGLAQEPLLSIEIWSCPAQTEGSGIVDPSHRTIPSSLVSLVGFVTQAQIVPMGARCSVLMMFMFSSMLCFHSFWWRSHQYWLCSAQYILCSHWFFCLFTQFDPPLSSLVLRQFQGCWRCLQCSLRLPWFFALDQFCEHFYDEKCSGV